MRYGFGNEHVVRYRSASRAAGTKSPVAAVARKFIGSSPRALQTIWFCRNLDRFFSGPLGAPAGIAAVAGMPRWKFELANVLSALIWTAWAVGIGAVSGQMIEPNGGWLPIGLIVVPVITIGISALIVHLRKPQR